MILSEDNPTKFAEIMQRSKISAYEAETVNRGSFLLPLFLIRKYTFKYKY